MILQTIAFDDTVKETDSETTASSVRSAMSDTRGSFSHLMPFKRTESRCSSTNMSDINQRFLPNIHDEKRNSNTPSKHSVIFKDDYRSFQPHKVTRVSSKSERHEDRSPSAIESRLGSVESLDILMKNIHDEKRNSNTPSKHSVIFKDDYRSFQPHKVTRVSSKSERHEDRSPSAIESRLGSVESLDILMKNINQFSKWKHIRRLVKGDYVGHEWLDFNNGVFEPPAEDWSLVSEGCELIMIKKEFLMEYLRKEW